MNRRQLITLAAVSPCMAACASTLGQAVRSQRVGMVVEESLAPGAATKEGIQGISDSGQQLFASIRLDSRNDSIGSYGATTVPRWVQVTWRAGPGIDMDWKTRVWIGGTVVGDFTVPVLERIPTQVFERIRAAPGRALRLRFRIRDDGVGFGWAIQQAGKSIPYDIQRGGDFVDSNRFRLVEE